MYFTSIDKVILTPQLIINDGVKENIAGGQSKWM